MRVYFSPHQLPELVGLSDKQRDTLIRRHRWKPLGRWSTWIALLGGFALLVLCRLPILMVVRRYGAELPPMPVLVLIAAWAVVSFMACVLAMVHVYFASMRPFLQDDR